ncbi:hypothetical protein FNL56_20895 [Tardiphaga sp. vice304]|uniref:hypothetical protein n=1 Tax=unclassified Tardiphaga TaxID=2631404 RepID=UPI001161D4EF|nr:MULTISPECIES: hypothetical protein [unclassified Tardiphaga]QDM18092.1 hypothetical protein FNL53_20715 [Tardiphaga sp. vice278]QDM23128.1 hypothetical protein FIU28_19750 [Tardiphaga sp. vice154]QDM28300.1 hypothetical protein FNL56_20895 [Tardiphaga sp. vice304]
MKIDDQETVIVAIELARRILGKYVEPGPRDAAATVQRLLELLDDNDLIKALHHLKRRQTIRLVDWPKTEKPPQFHAAAPDFAVWPTVQL